MVVKGIYVPLSVFSTELPPLVSIVYYLSKNHSVKHIARLLKRTPKTIYQAQAYTKRTAPPTYVSSEYKIPITAFADSLSIFESTVFYLRTQHNIKFSTIAQLTNRDPRTVWTSWKRAQKKHGTA